MKSDVYFWGGIIALLSGLVGTGVSGYYVATSSEKDDNATLKKVSLTISIVFAVIGILLMVWYYFGDQIDGTYQQQQGGCPLAQVAMDTAPPPQPPIDASQVPSTAPVHAPTAGANSINVNIHHNPVPTKIGV